ncbi:solanimycin biosynthesis MBL-fold hydrolase SolJ [Rouxiella chamberiensis]|uniref:MBL fold metallo-hydrolase n=1 Tax=Rouxiella chamberiensis TaxID=1513468 RepID=A0ABY7HU61_9GAMM|nr:solanimycin biosynthesis MBL-fold hydrolase SolJ [Rouxiella chamberiensis]WAT02507.1 MBL fold metallo-hydrolase [Rouxiella chamberiensis]
MNSSQEITVTTLKVSQGRFINNNYLVVNRRTGKALLIDPAWEKARLETALHEANAELAGILLTHAHADHTDLAASLADIHGCPVWMSRQEAQFSGFAIAALQTFEEQCFEVGGMMIRPVITPGHTPGSTCYWIGPHLFTGDTLFIEGCGLCPDRAAAKSMFASLERLKALLSQQVRIYPGHSYVQPPGLTLEQVFRFNLYLSLDDEEVFINFRMRSGQARANWLAFS